MILFATGKQKVEVVGSSFNRSRLFCTYTALAGDTNHDGRLKVVACNAPRDRIAAIRLHRI